MKTTVTFTPARNPAYPIKAPFSPINGLQVAYGLVIHPVIESKIRSTRGYWDVSDPGTGCLVAYGEYPGPEGAVAGLVQKAMAFKASPGGFRGALERGRVKVHLQLEAEAASRSEPSVIAGENLTVTGAIGQP